MNKHASPSLTAKAIVGGVATDTRHDSAHKHVTGQAVYIDDMPEPAGLLHAYLGLSTVPHGAILSMDLSAVRAAPGVVDVLTGHDMPASNDISPTHRHDEPVLATDKVQFLGQPIFAVVAETREQARRACRLAKVDYAEEPFFTDIAAIDRRAGKLVTPPLTLKRGDAAAAIAAAPRRLSGTMAIGGQDHFYLEGHIAMAIPGEDMDVTVHSSTQHPSEVQHMVAQVLGVPSHAVTVEVRRMGGGFGGKETQGNQFAAASGTTSSSTMRWASTTTAPSSASTISSPHGPASRRTFPAR
jgi:xanthine dehydrogenase large subunit